MAHNKKKRNMVKVDCTWIRKTPKPEIDKTVACVYNKEKDIYCCNPQNACVFKTAPKDCVKFNFTHREDEKDENSAELGDCNHEHARRYARWETIDR